MDAVALALASAALFGAMTVALRAPLARGTGPEAGALLTILPALAVAFPVAVFQGLQLGGLWPFVVAGALGPGLSQLLFTFAVRDAGPSRTSVVVGTAPLFSVVIAIAVLDEPVEAALIAGAFLIVAGGVLLAGERGRPGHVRLIGLAAALAATVVFAVRDNLVRHLSVEGDVSPALAASVTLAAGAVVVAIFAVLSHRKLDWAAWRGFLPAGLLFGVSYVCLFEAYERGRVSVVSPLVATESLWAVTLSALLLQRHELVGRRLAVGAALVVAGGALIGGFR